MVMTCDVLGAGLYLDGGGGWDEAGGLTMRRNNPAMELWCFCGCSLNFAALEVVRVCCLKLLPRNCPSFGDLCLKNTG